MKARRIIATRTLILWAGLAVVLSSATALHGEERPATIHLELTATRQPAQELPKPRAERVQEDAARAMKEIEARERVEMRTREAVPSPHPRPDLGYDVFSGIQSRHLTDILGPR